MTRFSSKQTAERPWAGIVENPGPPTPVLVPRKPKLPKPGRHQIMAHVTGGSDKPIRLRARPILSLPPCPTACLPAPVFIAPCLPSTADHPPAGPEWVHEIKHDGYRLMARRDPVGIRLLTRNGHDWADRYPLIVEAVNHLKASEYTWITVVFETKDEAEAAHKHAAKAVDGAKALQILNR